MYHGFTMLFVKVKKIKFHPCRHVQCNRGGGECWCVNAEGLEIPGSRQNGTTVHCKPFIILQLDTTSIKKKCFTSIWGP